MRDKYTIVLLNSRGDAIDEVGRDTLREAKEHARYMVTDEWARNRAESTHDAMDSVKSEVRNQAGECLFDKFI